MVETRHIRKRIALKQLHGQVLFCQGHAVGEPQPWLWLASGQVLAEHTLDPSC